MTEPVYISFSEIETFNRCKFKWDLSSSNRRSIRHKSTPRLYLSTGSAIHKALEAGVQGLDPLEVVRDYLAGERAAKVQAYADEYGSEPWPMEMAKFDEAADLALSLVSQYFDQYEATDSLADQGLKFIGLEVPFKIDISAHIEAPLSSSVYFCGTLDGIAVDEWDQIWIVETKTYTSKPSPEDIQWHFQAQGYAVAIEWLTGMPVAGLLYNGIAKKLMSEPKVLKKGNLSTDKRVATTYDRYLQAIRENGESVDDPRFADILSHLQGIRDQGDTRFFYREKVFFTDEQLDAWREDFHSVVGVMLDNPRIYRTIPYNGCGDCWFRDLCETKHSGGDVDFLLERRYTQGTYGTIQEVAGKTPTTISSIDELKEYLTNA